LHLIASDTLDYDRQGSQEEILRACLQALGVEPAQVLAKRTSPPELRAAPPPQTLPVASVPVASPPAAAPPAPRPTNAVVAVTPSPPMVPPLQVPADEKTSPATPRAGNATHLENIRDAALKRLQERGQAAQVVSESVVPVHSPEIAAALARSRAQREHAEQQKQNFLDALPTALSTNEERRYLRQKQNHTPVNRFLRAKNWDLCRSTPTTFADLETSLCATLQVFLVQVYGQYYQIPVYNEGPDRKLCYTRVLDIANEGWSRVQLRHWVSLIQHGDAKEDGAAATCFPPPAGQIDWSADEPRITQLATEVSQALMRVYRDVFCRIDAQDYKVLIQAMLARMIHYVKADRESPFHEAQCQLLIACELLLKAIAEGECSDKWRVMPLSSEQEEAWPVNTLLAQVGIRTPAGELYSPREPKTLLFFNPYGFRRGAQHEVIRKKYIPSLELRARPIGEVYESFRTEVLEHYKENHLSPVRFKWFDRKFWGRRRVSQTEDYLQSLPDEKADTFETRHARYVDFFTHCWNQIVETSSKTMGQLTLWFLVKQLTLDELTEKEVLGEEEHAQIKEALLERRLLLP
jgi:hypothetical protein